MFRFRMFLRELIFGLTLFFVFGAIANAYAETRMAVLIPDSTLPSDPLVTAWTDAAQEEGLKIDVITDSQFITMVSGGNNLNYQGVVFPDQVHVRASQTLIDSITAYVNAGGNAMLVFDFGALDENGFYPITGPSRLSSLAGVNYIMYSELGDQTTGLGPVTGLPAQLRRVQVPPGKSMVYSTTTSSTTQATFLKTSPTDPGGTKSYKHDQQFTSSFSELKINGRPIRRANTSTQTWNTLAAAPVSGTTKVTASPSQLEAISGYVYGYLNYPSYVTRGTFTGQAILSSPQHGLVAGLRTYGAAGGQVLFVNTPLTYLKGATDGMLMHGFLGVFGKEVLNMPVLSKQPNAVAGLTLNWHVDYKEAIPALQTLKQAGVWNNGPFSIDATAGPDTITFGDKLGMDLPNNPTAQQLLRELALQGHEIGSHGGWIHDYYGDNVSETNQFTTTADGINTFQDLLILNKNATENASGKPNREYSSPQGNNPKWALDWSESVGEIGYYFTGHTGMGPTRSYREGVLRNRNMWAFPVVPFGQYATFEEFQDFNISQSRVLNWYKSLIDFNIQTRTSRLIYLHPPGAVDWLPVLRSLLNYARDKGAAFQWYTMPDLAAFMTQRNQVTWSETGSGAGARQFSASHPSNLAKMTWLLPKNAYSSPLITNGDATVSDGGTVWVVKANSGTSLAFQSNHN